MKMLLQRINIDAFHEGVISLLLLSAALTMRPSFLGEILTPVALALAMAALLYAMLMRVQVDSRLLKKNLLIAGLVVLLWAFLSIHSLLLGGRQVSFLVKGMLVIPTLMFVFAWLLASPGLNQRFFRGLVWIFIAATISYLITILLAVPLSLDRLFLFHIESKTYDDKWGGVYFPFTGSYGVIKLFEITFFRFPGVFREAGIFQAFIVWAYLSLASLNMEKWWIRLLLLVALIATFSTAGVIVFFVTLLLKAIFIGRELGSIRGIIKFGLLSVPLLLLGAGMLLYAPIFGLLEKTEKSNASVGGRMEGTMAGLNGFMDNPFGVGIYNDNIENVGVNLISSFYYIGVIGAILIALVFVVAILLRRSMSERKLFILLMLPFVVTWLFSQPFIESPLIFIMLMQWTGHGGVANDHIFKRLGSR